jgi:bacillithiol system protein YtxJ
MPEHVLRDLAAFEHALQQHPRVLLFKHSPACPISAAARAQYERWRAELPDSITAGALHAVWAPRC